MENLSSNAGAENIQPESAIMPFDFNGHEVRVHKDQDGEPWFVAKNVAEILGYSDTSAMCRRLDDEEKTTLQIPQVGSNYKTNILLIDESGLYNAILGSNKPEAKAFKRWVTHEVLPSIRKNGGYIHTTPEMSDDEIMARALQVAQRTIDRKNMVIEEQTRQLALQALAVEYCNEVLSAENLHTVNSIAVHLGISARKLNEFLIDADWIYKQGGIYCPSCKIRNKGYCDYHIVPYFNSQGGKETREHLKWTENGRKAIIDLWQKRHSA